MPYSVGEEVIYKHNDHIEKGIIEKIYVDKDPSQFVAIIKFSGNRTVRANFDEIMAQDETDVSAIPFSSEDYL